MASAMTGDERRNYERLKSNVEIELTNITIPPFDDSEFTTVNLGGGGLLCETDQEYPLLSTLLVRLILPGETTPIVAKATVVRVEYISGTTYDIGLSFKEIHDRDRRKILKYVNKGGKLSVKG